MSTKKPRDHHRDNQAEFLKTVLENQDNNPHVRFLMDAEFAPPLTKSNSSENKVDRKNLESFVKSGLIDKIVADNIPSNVQYILIRRKSDRKPEDPEASLNIHSDGRISTTNTNYTNIAVVEIDDAKKPNHLTFDQLVSLKALTMAMVELNPKAIGDAPQDLVKDIQFHPSNWTQVKDDMHGEKGKSSTKKHTFFHGYDREFIRNCADALSSSEGEHTSINWKDTNGYPSFGRAQWNQKGGLPQLLEALYQANSSSFKTIISNAYAVPYQQQGILPGTSIDHAQEICDFFKNQDHNAITKFVEDAQINRTSPLGIAMGKFLNDKAFWSVQDNLLNGNIVEAIKLSNEYGHNSQLFVAMVADMTNQLGPAGVRQCLDKANATELDEHAAILPLYLAGQKMSIYRPMRDLKLAKIFSRDKIVEKKPDKNT